MWRASTLALLLLFVVPMQCNMRRVLIVPDFNNVQVLPLWHGHATYQDFVRQTRTI